MPLFPGQGGGGPNSGPGLNPQTIYVSPSGSDSNDGLTSSAAVRTGYVGYQLLQDAGGGRLFMANNSSWGGPVSGQGCWIRGDGRSITGWLQAVPSVIEVEGELGANLFSLPGKGFLRGGSNDAADFRTKPSIWLTCNVQNIVNFKNIKPKVAIGHEGLTGNFQTLWGWRIGWDYIRDPATGAIDYLDIVSGERLGTASTFTVNLPNPGVVVTSARRLSNVTTLTISSPGSVNAFPPWNTGTKIWFEVDGGVSEFTSGAYSVFGGASLEESTKWSFSFSDPGPDTAVISDPGYVRTSQVTVGDYIDLQVDDPVTYKFVSNMYLVTACTINDADTADITVYDYFSGKVGYPDPYGPVSFSGRIVKQERGFGQVLQPNLYNCANWFPQEIPEYARYLSGPGFDFGSCTAIPPIMDQCALQGYWTIDPDEPYDADRMSAIFAYGGAEGMASMDMRSCTGNLASLRYKAGSKSAAVTIDLISDTGNGLHPPIYNIDITSFVDVNVIRADAADAIIGVQGVPVITGSYDPSKIRGTNLPTTTAGIMPTIGNGLVWKTNPAEGGYSTTPWTNGKVGVWTAELRFAGRHPAGNRQISPTNARFQNLVIEQDSWVNVHGSMTTGQLDPQGGLGGVKLTDIGDGSMYVKLRSGPDSDTSFEEGGTYVIAGWVNFPTGDFNGSRLFRFEAAGGSDLVWETGGSSWDYQCLAAVPGWQYIVASRRLVSGSASQSYEIQVTGPPNDSEADGYIAFMSAFWAPPTLSVNDIAEYIGTLRAQPQYLQPGQAGTFEGQKFIGHGGLGISSGITKVVGAGSGELTLTGTGTVYEPRYGADGTTIVGWVALLQATINP